MSKSNLIRFIGSLVANYEILAYLNPNIGPGVDNIRDKPSKVCAYLIFMTCMISSVIILAKTK